MNQELKKRLKSLAWRVGMMTVAFVFSATADNLGILHLGDTATLSLGLILGEVSKSINNFVTNSA